MGREDVGTAHPPGSLGWQTIDKAPERQPVRVWACFNPADRLMSWREFIATKRFEGWWQTYDKQELRLFPTHWRPLDPPSEAMPSGNP